MTEEINEPVGTESVAEQAAPAPQSAPDLNISDLLAVKNIIEVATSRGAFKAAELEAVGKTFNKLNTFLESVSKKEA
jgi:hypothetical protein